MKSFKKVLHYRTETRRAFLNITADVRNVLRESGIMEGLCLVNAMHITASVFINDDERGLHQDSSIGWRNWLRKNHIPNIATTAMKTMPTHT